MRTRNSYRSSPENKSLTIALILLALAALGFFAITAVAQNVKNTDYSPDKTLKSNARVNPSTLAMEMTIPLIGFPGRAGNGKGATLNYSSKVWGMENYGQWLNNFDVTINDIRPTYARFTAAGWTSNLGTVRIEYSTDTYRDQGSGAYEQEGQIYEIPLFEATEPDGTLYYMKRAQVIMPDGSSHEMRVNDTPVECGSVQLGTGCTGRDMTGTYLSVDGSRMRLEAGASTSVLYMPDGSRYLFGAPSGNLNLATSFYDVHGNKSLYDSTDREWTDTMGRLIADPLPNNWNGLQNQSVGTVSSEFPGLASTTYDVDYVWVELDEALLDPEDDLAYIGRRACSGGSYTLLSPYLFEDGSDPNTRLCNLGSVFNPVVLSEVTLPNGQSYEFKYNIFGEITKIIYPSGAYERFVYGQHEMLRPASFPYEAANRGVTDRYVSEKGDGTDEVHSTYAVSMSGGYNVTSTNPDGTYARQYLYMDPAAPPTNPYGFSFALAGRPYDERVYDDSNVLRSRKLTAYETTGPLSGGYSYANRDMRPTKEISIIFEPGDSNALATMTETVYDTAGNSDPAYFSSLNAKQAKKYSYVVVSASTAASANVAAAAAWFTSGDLATVTEVDYLYDSNYKARNIVGLVTETRVKDAAGNVKAKSQIAYDETVTYPLLTDVSSTRWEDPSSNYRGLVTTTKSWYDIGNNLSIETHAQYDQLGNLRKSWDGRGNLSQTTYSSTYAYAYPTSVITPIPNSDPTYGSNAAFESTVTYDYNTGLPTFTTDANGQTTEMKYEDPLLRPTKVIAPNGAETVTEYGAGTDASTRYVKVTSDLDATNTKYSYTWFDGLGRTWLSQSEDSASDVFAVTCYDNMGRVSKTSNPFRNVSNPGCSSSLEWTTPAYDDLGRTISVTTPDSAVVETTYGLATSGSQIGTAVTVEDQAGKVRRSITNALGQLTRVDEPTTSGLGTISSPNQATLYAYDTLNNLTTVTQGAQTRTFSYDALSRLKSATNPESGTINYTYDANSNLATKLDARNIITTYTYDRLNRVTLRAYTNEPSGSETPDVTYFYDNVTNAKGKLTKVSSSVSTTEYTAFDILGRVTSHKQTTDGNDYTTGYSYSLSGQLLEQTYPSGRVVKDTYDTADGSLSQVQSKRSAETYRNFANGFITNAAGAVTAMRLGNGKWENTVFNARMQPTQIGLGNGVNSQNLLKLQYEYGSTASVNNGNVTKQTITVPGVAHPFIQTYAYDELNRLTNAEEIKNSVQQWEQTFSYDRFGNRNFNEGETTFAGFNKLCTGNTVLCTDLKKKLNPSVDTSNNRLDTDDDYAYDSVGNMTEDPEGKTFVYNAENKQISVSDGGGLIGVYVYDGDGKRIKKYVPGTDEITIFIYDASGKLIQEHSTIIQTGGNAKTVYTTNDNLGSPRINTDGVGAVVSRHDYHPFGEEIDRTSVGYGSDTIRKQFTGYEKDGESGLDFAQGRMYARNLGRFTTPDPLLSSSRPTDPRCWNRFTYVRNNPLRLVDPSGFKDEESQQKKAKRKVYIFIFMTEKEQTRSATVTNETTGEKTSKTLVAAPSFEGLKKLNKNATVIVKGGDATLKDFTDALQDKDAAGVIFIGHTTGGYFEKDGKQTYVADGLMIDMKGTSNPEAYNSESRVDVKAGFVGVFGCDGTVLDSNFAGASSLGLTYSGENGLSSTSGGTQAGYAAARSIIMGRGPDDAVAQANSALQKTTRPMDVDVGGSRHRVTDPDQDGDQVLRYK